MSKKWWILFLLVIVLVPSSQAAFAQIDISNSISTVGQWINNVFSNEYATFAVTIITLMILLRSIFAASLRKVKVFEGSGGTGINTFGNSIAWSLSILASVSLYYLKAGASISRFLTSILGPSAMFAAIVILIVLFWWYKGATGSGGWAMILTGLSSVAISKIVQWPMIASVGVFLLMGGMFWVVGRNVSRKSHKGEYTQTDLKNESKAADKLYKQVKEDSQDERLAEKDELDEQLLEQMTNDLENRRIILQRMINQKIESGNAIPLPELMSDEKTTKAIIENEERKIDKETEIQRIETELKNKTMAKESALKKRIDEVKKDSEMDSKLQRDEVNKINKIVKGIVDISGAIVNNVRECEDITDEQRDCDKKILGSIQGQIDLARTASIDPKKKGALSGIQEIGKKQTEKAGYINKKHSLMSEIRKRDEARRKLESQLDVLLRIVPTETEKLENEIQKEEGA